MEERKLKLYLSAEEKAKADQVLGYASEVAAGNVLRSSGVSKSL